MSSFLCFSWFVFGAFSLWLSYAFHISSMSGTLFSKPPNYLKVVWKESHYWIIPDLPFMERAGEWNEPCWKCSIRYSTIKVLHLVIFLVIISGGRGNFHVSFYFACACIFFFLKYIQNYFFIFTFLNILTVSSLLKCLLQFDN